MKKINKYKILIFTLALFLCIFLVYKEQTDSSVERSDAIYGGKIEDDYESASYIFSYLYKNDQISTCGSVLLNDNLAITAAHCINDESSIYFGTKDFSIKPTDNYILSSAQIHPEWKGSGYTDFDLAVVVTKENISGISEFAVISTPKENCNYEIVGYGQTEVEENLDPNKKLRKSTEVCIENITDDLIFIKGKDGGVCFGDSGSPIFEKGTNRVVGLLSAIYSDNNAQPDCRLNNKAIAVNLSSQVSFINRYSQNQNVSTTNSVCGQSCNSDLDCEGLLICKNNTCLLSNETDCSSASGDYCSIIENVACGESFTCINNTCKKVNEIEDGFEIAVSSSNSFFKEQDDNSQNIMVAMYFSIFLLLLVLANIVFDFVKSIRIKKFLKIIEL